MGGNKGMEQFTLRLKKDDLEKIRVIAKEENRSVNHIINTLVKMGLEYGENKIK